VSGLVVIGGGIAGLAAAWAARRAGLDDVTILERGADAGGKIRTDVEDGFLLEAGPDSFLSRKPAGVRLSNELGLAPRFLARTPRAVTAFVRRGQTLHPLPQGFSGMVPTDLEALATSPLLSEAGRRRALMEPSIPPHQPGADIPVARFMRDRFGVEAFDVLIEPLVSGIYAADADQLSLDATFPHLREMEHRYGSLTAAFRQDRRDADDAGSRLPAFVSFPGGMGELVTALENRLGAARIRLGAEASSLERRGAGFRMTLASGETLEADAVVLATPAHETARIARVVVPGLAEAAQGIAFSSSAIVHIAFRRDDVRRPLDAHGWLVPAVEQSLLLGCTWTSSKWTGRAPDSAVLLRFHAGRYGRPAADAGDDELVLMCRDDLARTLGIDAAPVLARVQRWPRGMPQYTMGHALRLSSAERALSACPGLFVAGSSWHGVGVPDCIESGEAAARRALALLGKGNND
jgi:oxygen-dependent protoporphyrinogen oxidase